MPEKNTIWDPLRKKNVALTPEEKVRQWFIGVLASHMEVPLHMMMSETGFRLGDKLFRADILVYDRKAAPLIFVECKRPETELSEEVLDQVVRYNMVLGVRFIVITNGLKTYILEKKAGGYGFTGSIPKYNEICQRQ
ncbi:MAG: type I restriction enzyme HsdR N-terminal domain-containing protein [Bacteroidales bacterium]|nr:type I restriction enzyme HsdR N-terminal domain-containing protein [Bacteroidales bacterium]